MRAFPLGISRQTGGVSMLSLHSEHEHVRHVRQKATSPRQKRFQLH